MNLDDSSELKRRLGFGVNLNSDADRKRLTEIINAKLWFRGQPIVGKEEEFQLLKITRHLLANFQEKNRLLADYLCPADARIQAFLDRSLADCGVEIPRLPTNSLQLEHHGIARTLSLPPDRDDFSSEILSSYRVEQGVLHYPRSDRRTTKGVFHVVGDEKLSKHDFAIKLAVQFKLSVTSIQKAKLEELLEEFSLGHVRKNLGHNLSGGEKRRTEIGDKKSIKDHKKRLKKL